MIIKFHLQKKLSTKVQILVFMMGPCELQPQRHLILIEEVGYCKRKRKDLIK